VTGVPAGWTGALATSGLTIRELSLACFALGGNSTRDDLEHYFAGDVRPSVFEHAIVAQALNERLHDLGHDWPLAYQRGERD
jgi:hypothetical protein